jgi:hypothetical protein
LRIKSKTKPVLDDQVHPTASSGSLQHSKVNKTRFSAHPESTVLDRFGKKHRPTSGPRLFPQAVSSRAPSKLRLFPQAVQPCPYIDQMILPLASEECF